MLSPEQVRAFEDNGFVLGPQVIGADEVEQLRREVLEVIDRRNASCKQPVLLRNLTGREDAPVWQIVNIYEVSEAFARLVHNPKVVEAAAQLCKAKELRIWHDQIQYKPASKGGVNMWHQDGPLWPVLQPKDQQVTAWVALDDAAEDNGCMTMVPGSNHWGNQQEYLNTLSDFTALPDTFEGHAVTRRLCPVPAGCVHFHHSLTWHASHANTSGRPRRAIALHYFNEKTRYDASGKHVMQPFITVADGQPLAGDRFQQVYPAS